MNAATSTPSTEATAAEARVARATVAVLAGGRTGEREVSLASGSRVADALAQHSAGDERGPAAVRTVDLRADGTWAVAGRALPPAEALTALADVDAFFVALHGGEGEDGTLQGLLAACGRVFTGSGVAGSALCMDKVVACDLAAHHGLRVARGRTIVRGDRIAAVLDELAAWNVPGWVVKPRRGGSSVGASIARTPEELAEAIAASHGWEREALVEELIEGTELTGSVVPDEAGTPLGLTTIEIRPRSARFFDYEEKYSEGGALELCPPESVSSAAAERVRVLSLRLHELLGCEGFSRSDFMLPGGETEPVFLETNTVPGLTPRSLVPLAAAHDGIDYRTLCLRILQDAFRRDRR